MQIISSGIQDLEGLTQEQAMQACRDYCGNIQVEFCFKHLIFPCHPAVVEFKETRFNPKLTLTESEKDLIQQLSTGD